MTFVAVIILIVVILLAMFLIADFFGLQKRDLMRDVSNVFFPSDIRKQKQIDRSHRPTRPFNRKYKKSPNPTLEPEKFRKDVGYRRKSS